MPTTSNKEGAFWCAALALMLCAIAFFLCTDEGATRRREIQRIKSSLRDIDEEKRLEVLREELREAEIR